MFKNVTKPLNLTKLLNLTKPLTRPTPIIETYDMLVTVRHNLEVTNTTKPYTIDIFSVNKTIIPPSNATTILTNAVNKSTTTLTNALNNKTNVILNAAKSLLNKSTSTKLPVDNGRPTVPTNTKNPPLSRKASNIDNKTGGKTTVTPKKTVHLLSKLALNQR